MKIDTTKILLIILILLLGWQNFFKTEDEKEPEPITIVIPESKGTTGKVNLEQPVKVVPIYINGSNNTVEVDSKYKELYEKTQDSLKRAALYLDAITVRKYNDTLIDNDEITIKGEASTRGSLLSYDVEYFIKEKELTYTPEVVTKLPKLSLGLGVELGVPTIPNKSFSLKGNVSLMNNKGKEISVGYDTDKRVWVGFKKTFKIIK